MSGDIATCPVCRAELDDPSDFSWNPADQTRTECPWCDSDIVITRHVHVTYSASTDPAGRPPFGPGDIVRALDRLDYELVEQDAHSNWSVKRNGKLLPPPCALPESHMTLVRRGSRKP